ncbi:MAG TPA: hypothetical protein VN802_03140 [Stellaceae bacterium]|nr:hypothetical protein [Stellaceae bacterium]
MAIDAQDEPETEAADASAPPPSEQAAIRGAFLARQAQAGASSGGEGDNEAANPSVRGAFLSRLTRETQPTRTTRARVAAGGTEETGDAVLRLIYAARTVTVAAPGRTRRAAKAAPPRKARPAKKAARKAAPKAVKKTAKKAVKKAAPGRKARAAAPARRPKKAAKRARRR